MKSAEEVAIAIVKRGSAEKWSHGQLRDVITQALTEYADERVKEMVCSECGKIDDGARYCAICFAKAVEEAFEERGYAFQNAIQKCLEEKQKVKAEAYEDAAKIVEDPNADFACCSDLIAARIRARSAEMSK